MVARNRGRSDHGMLPELSPLGTASGRSFEFHKMASFDSNLDDGVVASIHLDPTCQCLSFSVPLRTQGGSGFDYFFPLFLCNQARIHWTRSASVGPSYRSSPTLCFTGLDGLSYNNSGCEGRLDLNRFFLPQSPGSRILPHVYIDNESVTTAIKCIH